MVSVMLLSLVAIGSCFATPTLIVIVLIAVYALYIVYVRRKYQNISNPPYKNFILGNAEDFLLAKRNRYLLWITWGKAYGPLFKLCLLHKVMIMVTSPALAKKICLNSNYPKSKESYLPLQTLYGEKFMGSGLVTEMNHEHWRFHRSILNPAFYKNYLKRFVHVFEENVFKLIEKIHSLDGADFSLLDIMNRVLMDVICEVAFSFKPNCLADKNNPFTESVYRVLRAISEHFDDPFFKFKPWNWKKVKYRKKAVRFIRETGKELIRKRLEELQENNAEKRDILDMMIANSKEDGVNEELLVDDFVTLLVAGQETTANSIAFLFYLLSNNNEVKQRAQKEADEFFESYQKIKYEYLKDLPLIEACWKESLRLYPPAFATVREIPKGLEELNGHQLPVGSNVVVSFLAIHYNHCSDGPNFNPDRILEGRDEPYTNIPFSLGQRSCIGRFFAEIEAKIVVATLLYKFDFQLSPDQTFDIDEALTLRLRDGCRLTMTPRLTMN